ncbi:MAG: Unknown protein [uncultured Sulfurovum sp.]|uniref:YfdX protein n=1 Tax=uncultured Sulfurovum sp. TaxID=269237 RepID=A0A6S6UAV3_9BACT|nr:MAG: Unknown protein [uncultured Sulfurovum sp.]
MKTMKINKTNKLSLITSLLLLANVTLYATENIESNFKSTTDTPIHNYYDFSSATHKISNEILDYYQSIGLKDYKSCQNTVKNQYQKLEKTPKEIFDGLNLTIDAIKALDNNNSTLAQKNLGEASAIFEKVFKANPELKMIPIDIDIKIEDHQVSNENVKAITENAIRMLKEHDTQEAIALLTNLKNQINITTLYLPMAFYEMGTKVATEALKKENKIEAMDALSLGFNSMIIEESIIPIALLESQSALLSASIIEKDDKEEALKWLDIAKSNLEQARLLGYTSKYNDDYQLLSNQIHSIAKEIKGKNEVEKLYDTLKNDYNKFLDKIIGDIPLIGA